MIFVKVPICWMFNGKPLVHNAEQIQMSVLSNGNYSMTLRQLKRSQNGTINFTAGKIRLTAKLTVLLPKFRFCKDLEPVSCHVGECVVLLTELNHLEHEVKWFKDGEEISPKSNHYTIFSEGTMRKLRIGSSKEEDTATYSVCHIDDLTNKVIIFLKY